LELGECCNNTSWYLYFISLAKDMQLPTAAVSAFTLFHRVGARGVMIGVGHRLGH
jgi:hypothetical protein